VLETDAGEIHAALLVAADGLHSPIRRAAALERLTAPGRRLGLRRHFRVAPWGRAVEVHMRPGIEAFVTPAGSERVGLAFLWDRGAIDARPDFAAFLGAFPLVAERIHGAEPDSEERGAGPFAQRCRVPIADRLVLVGDAAGFEDAITADGVTLAFGCASALGQLLQGALARGATRDSLAPYACAFESAFRRHAFYARAMLALSRRPRLRRGVTRSLSLAPRVVDHLMTRALS
jgi:flavin-dependent dehydrogenase